MPSRSSLTLVTALVLSAPLPLLIAHAQPAHDGPAKAIERAKSLQPYDVVSVKENNSGQQNGYYNIDDKGLYTATNMPFSAILAFAYDVKQGQITGLSGRVNSARFDVIAKVLAADPAAAPELPDGDLQAMVILLLQDRFHLKAHLEPKIAPVYDLVVAKGGLKIKLSQDEIHFSNCGISRDSTSKALTGKNCTMTDIAYQLADGVGRKVIDKTGLTGHSDIMLKWSDDVTADQGNSNTVSIFAALEEQLGLKLQPAKGPVDTLVIDHAEMPSEN
jgi:uncharacterized protein (TIGR03435 family)